MLHLAKQKSRDSSEFLQSSNKENIVSSGTKVYFNKACQVWEFKKKHMYYKIMFVFQNPPLHRRNSFVLVNDKLTQYKKNCVDFRNLLEHKDY